MQAALVCNRAVWSHPPEATIALLLPYAMQVFPTASLPAIRESLRVLDDRGMFAPAAGGVLERTQRWFARFTAALAPPPVSDELDADLIILSAAGGTADAQYVHGLEDTMSVASETRMVPVQTLWCRVGTSVVEVDEWLNVAMKKGLLETIVAVGVDSLVPRSRDVLQEALRGARYHLGASATLVSGSAVTGICEGDDAAVAKGSPAASVRDALRAYLRRAVPSVRVVCGEARSGKSSWCDAQFGRDGCTARARWSVHESFSGAVAIESYRAAAAEATRLRRDGGGVVIGIHVDVYDCPGSLPALAQLLHALLACALVHDAHTGAACALMEGATHHVIVELPALCALDAAAAPHGPRAVWPARRGDQQHPF
jgi:hypothetical protein